MWLETEQGGMVSATKYCYNDGFSCLTGLKYEGTYEEVKGDPMETYYTDLLLYTESKYAVLTEEKGLDLCQWNYMAE